MKSYHQVRERWTTRAGERVLFGLAQGVEFLISPFSTWRTGGLFAPLIGGVMLLVPSVRRRLGDNVDHVWPDLDASRRRRLMRDTARHFARLMLEYAAFRRFARETEIAAEGLGHLRDALGRGGVFVVSAHYGNWEAVRLAARREGIEVGIIYRAFNNRYLTAYTDELIAGAGAPVLHKGAAGMRGLMAHVAKGGAAMVLIDQRTTGAPLIPFLGRDAETVTLVAGLAARTGATVLTAVARRDVAARRFAVTIEPPVPEGTPEAMMTEVNARISRWIEAEPAQWFWFHRRWKRARLRD